MGFFELFLTLAFTLAENGDSDASAAAPLVLLLSGFIFYALMYSRYRNADKRHSHESETTATMANLVATDTFIKKRRGMTNAKMHGSNHTRIEGALNQQGGLNANKLIKKFMP